MLNIVCRVTVDGVVQFTHGIEEEKAWISEHLARAHSPRPMLDVTMQLANIISLSNVINSHKPLLQRVVDVGQNLLQRCHSLPQNQRSWQANIEAELEQLDAMWRKLEMVVREQMERLGASNATDPVRQVI